MTTLVALADDRRLWMASDSQTNVYERPVVGAGKIVRLRAETSPHVDGAPEPGEVLIGVSGAGALLPLIRDSLTLGGVPGAGQDPQRWADAVARAVSDLAREAGVVDDGQLDGALLLGWNGLLWTITHCLAIAHPDGRAALGSGEGAAIGALDALMLTGVYDLERAVVDAARIGISRNRHSGGEVLVEFLPPQPARDDV